MKAADLLTGQEATEEDPSTGQCSKENGHAPTAEPQSPNFLFNQEKEARCTAVTAIGTESQQEISADNTTTRPSGGFWFGENPFCMSPLFCGIVVKRFDAPNTGRRKPMKRESWYECRKCGVICDSNDFGGCTPHWQDTPTELHFTIEEVVGRVWPDIGKIRLQQPSLLNMVVTKILLGVLTQILKDREQALRVVESIREAVPM